MPYDTCRYLAFQYKKWEKYARELGHDQVDDYIITQWMLNHIAERYHDEYMAHLQKIDYICQEKCQNHCRGLEKCILSCEAIEEILENTKEVSGR